MKLLRYGDSGAEKPGMLDGNIIRDLSTVIDDWDPSTISAACIEQVSAIDPVSLPSVTGNPRIGPCVGNPGKFICIGLNYSDHASEAGMPVPPEPIVFSKATSAICGPNDNIQMPRHSVKSDWEVELGVIIGKHAKYVSEDEALDYVSGYCVVNDLSEREFQLERAGQWIKGKSCDTYGPIGPWFVTTDEISDPQNLLLWMALNGQRMQDGSTRTMIFTVAHIISYLSQFMSLHPGDIIATGTPPGVGMGMKPQQFLYAGDVVEAGVEGLGTQKQSVVADD